MGRPSNAMLAERAARQAEAPVIEPPVVLELPIKRFTPDDIDAWFLMRLEDRWPGYSEQTWRGKFSGFAASNDFLCIANERAVALMFTMRHLMTGRPVVFESLMWSRDSERNAFGDWAVGPRDPNQQPMLSLYRHTIRWAEQMKACRVIVAASSDMLPSVLREKLDGHYMVDIPC